MNQQRALFCIASAAGLAACALVNEYDPLPQPGGSPVAVDEASTDRGADAAGAVDSGAPPPPATSGGAIVVGGVVDVAGGAGGTRCVLSVLDPNDGHELSREPLCATAVVYDPLRDLWFVFASAAPPYTPSTPARLQVRRLDARSGRWEILGAANVPRSIGEQAVALRDRLGYVGYAASTADGGAASDGGLALAVIGVDVADPTAPRIYATQTLSKEPAGLMGTPSIAGAGGVINVVQRGTYQSGPCVELLQVLFPPDAPPSLGAAPVLLTNARYPDGGSAAFGSSRSDGYDLIATRAQGQQLVTLQHLHPWTSQTAAPAVTFPTTGAALRPLIVAECMKVALFVEGTTDLRVHAVPLRGGTPAVIATGHPGQGLRFEPYTKTVLAPYTDSRTSELSAFRLGGTTQFPSLKRRDDWAPPPDLRPLVVATREPAGMVCP
jgi:hypothetical protein